MQPPSFDEFIRKDAGKKAEQIVEEPFLLTVCPVPGCGSAALRAQYERGQLVGFSCANGCRLSVRRNVFTGDVMYYILDDTLVSHAHADSRGMKFTPLGEPYTDWY